MTDENFERIKNALFGTTLSMQQARELAEIIMMCTMPEELNNALALRRRIVQ